MCLHFISIFLPHRSAALCLAQALLKFPVPKSLSTSPGREFVGVGVTDGSACPTLKEVLTAWLLMTDQSDEMEDSSRPHPIICRLVDYVFSNLNLPLCSNTVLFCPVG